MNYQGYNVFKKAYIQEFNRMEKQLREIDNKKLLLADLFSEDKMVVVNAHKQLIELEKKPLLDVIESNIPKVEYHDKVLNCDKLITTTEIAKDLGISATKLNRKLNELKIIYKKSNTWMLYSKYQDRVPEYADYRINEFSQSLVWTEKGREWILNLIKE